MEVVMKQNQNNDCQQTNHRVFGSGMAIHPITPKRIEQQKGKLIFFYEWCKKCGICVYICPTKALAAKKDGTPYMADESKCTLCSLCWRICPDFAIMKNPNWEEPKNAPK